MGFDPSSAAFTAFRKEFSFPYYPPVTGPAVQESDSLILVLYILSVIIATVIITALGTRGSSKLLTVVKGFVLLGILSTILVDIYSHNWLVGWSDSALKKLYYDNRGTSQSATVGINIGLLEANITLRTPTVHYKEAIGWASTTQAESDYAKSLAKGLPDPILRVAEYLSVDEGGLRWMRAYRKAGFAAYICLWASVTMWVVCVILYTMAALHAALAGLACGVFQLIAVIAYGASMPGPALEMPLHDGEFLALSFGWSFWLTLFVGLGTVAVNAVVLYVAYYHPETINKILEIEDVIYVPFGVGEDDMDYSKQQAMLSRIFSVDASLDGEPANSKGKASPTKESPESQEMTARHGSVSSKPGPSSLAGSRKNSAQDGGPPRRKVSKKVSVGFVNAAYDTTPPRSPVTRQADVGSATHLEVPTGGDLASIASISSQELGDSDEPSHPEDDGTNGHDHHSDDSDSVGSQASSSEGRVSGSHIEITMDEFTESPPTYKKKAEDSPADFSVVDVADIHETHA